MIHVLEMYREEVSRHRDNLFLANLGAITSRKS